jgi:hypothetical protein
MLVVGLIGPRVILCFHLWSNLHRRLGASLPAGSRVGDYSWAFKNGFWNIINSMTVEFNNNNIIQQTPFLNVFRSFKAHTGWSEDDLKNNGASCGYYPDNAGSWSYSNNYNCGDC